MAEASVSSVLEQLDFIRHHDSKPMTRSVATQLLYLTDTLSSIRSLIADAEIKQSADLVLKNWLRRIEEEAYDMEDFLDEWLTEILRSSQQQEGEEHHSTGVKNMACCCLISSTFVSTKRIASRDRRVQKMKDTRKRLDFINSWGSKFSIRAAPKINTRPDLPSIGAAPKFNNRPGLLSINEPILYGRNWEKKFIVDKLVKDSLEHEMGTGGCLFVLCIVGLGGIGKTTLVRSIYNDDQVKSHFDLIIWVYVSNFFDEERIAREIIQAATGESVNNDGSGFDDLRHRLSDCVRKKRFLLVLDDVWNEDMEKWEELNHCLERGAKGSSILVTTRLERVAYMMSTTPLHRVQILSDEDSWRLFSQYALVGRDEQEFKMLENIGIAIVKKCNGLPLAVSAIARSLLYKTRQEWLSVLERLEQPLGSLTYLDIAFYNLDPHVRRCFAYIAIFPGDYLIEMDMLIKLWMAQGFLGSSTRGTDLEQIGEEYFQCLVRQFFLQDLKCDKDKKVTHCRMHDLIHDLALSNSFFMGWHNHTEAVLSSCNVPYLRHLSISNTELASVLRYVCEAKKLRTLKLFKCRWDSPTIPRHLFENLRCLRVLDLSFLCFEEIPSEVGGLMHLKYLDLTSTKLKYLPETVCALFNLQTLKLNDCGELCELPKQMKKLINLRHLEIQDTPKLCCLPKGISRLSSLRTLSKFIVSATKGECKIGELKDLYELRGNIDIKGLCNVKSLGEANEAGLPKKRYLRNLILDFSPYELENVEEGEVGRMENVLEGLQPHPSLEKLAILHCHFLKFPSWMVSGSVLYNLRILTIHDCKECIELPALGKLRSLQELHLQKLDGVKHIGSEFYGLGSGGGGNVAFPMLEELHVVDMANLEDWDFIVQDEKVMPRLCDLSLQDCAKLMSLPQIFPDTLKNLSISGCPKLPSSALEKLNLQGVKVLLTLSTSIKEFPETSSSPSASQF